MSHRLRVRVHLYSTVVEDRVLHVRDRVRLGEASAAHVSFPGADLVVWSGSDGRLWVRGAALEPGAVVRVHLGAVELELEAMPADVARPRWDVDRLLGSGSPIPDPRLFLATVSIALAAAFWESAGTFFENDPDAAAQVAALFGAVEPLDATERANARNEALQTPVTTPVDDPLAFPPVAFEP